MLFEESIFRQHRRTLITPSRSAPAFSTFYRSASSGNGWSSPASSSSSLSSASEEPASRRSSPPKFSHNARVAVGLVPAAAVLLDLGGTPVITVLMVGLMVAYVLYTMQMKSAAFSGVWLSLLAVQIAFYFSSSVSFPSLSLTSLALLLCVEINFQIGVWVSLQFCWINIENLSTLIAFERLLFACLPVTAPAILSWAVVSAIGMTNAAFYHMVFSCILYWLFSLPRPSSFKSKHEAENQILGSLESCLHALHLLFGPLFFHLSSHHSTIFSSFSSICEPVLLFFIPFLFMLYASTREALWWVTQNADFMHRVRVLNGAAGMMVVMTCLGFKVFFHSCERFLHVPPPLNYVLVTVLMFGGASAVGSYALGLTKDPVGSAAFTVLMVLASAVGAIIMGFPLLLIPLPLLSSYHLARFFTNSKSLGSYFAFAILTALMTTWFIVDIYWDLEIWIANVPLKFYIQLTIASVLLAMIIPGLAFLSPKLQLLTEFCLISHALLLCYIEDRFLNHKDAYSFEFLYDTIYPYYMVMTTTFLGLALLWRLVVSYRVGQKAVWILMSLYSSKLLMILITSKSIIWESTVLFLAVSSPWLLYKDRTKESSRMKSWQGFFHAAFVTFSMWLFRETTFEVLQRWNGRPPSDGLMLGSYILLTGLSCMPIVALHFPDVEPAKRFMALVIATALLFIRMEPSLPPPLAHQSDFINAAHQYTDDMLIYGPIESKPSWPAWLLIATAVLLLAAATSAIPIRHTTKFRAHYAVVVGTTLGIYICAEYFPKSQFLHPLIVTSLTCGSILLVFTHLPSASSPRLLPWVFALLVALLPVSYLSEGLLNTASITASEGAKVAILGLHAMLFMLIALGIKLQLASHIREKAAERGPSLTASTSSRSSLPAKLRLANQRRASVSSKALTSEAAWTPAVGNISTVLCFVASLTLNMKLTGGSTRSIFLLAPILLLLNQDSGIFTGLGDKRRYFPVAAATSGYLFLAAVCRIWEELWEIGGSGWVFAVKNGGLLTLVSPNHALFIRFMWDYAKQTDAQPPPLLTVPLSLLSVTAADVVPIRVLGLLAVAYSLVQSFVSTRTRMAGMKYI